MNTDYINYDDEMNHLVKEIASRVIDLDMLREDGYWYHEGTVEFCDRANAFIECLNRLENKYYSINQLDYTFEGMHPTLHERNI